MYNIVETINLTEYASLKRCVLSRNLKVEWELLLGMSCGWEFKRWRSGWLGVCVYKDQRKGMNGLEEGYKMLCYKIFQPFLKVITMCTFSTVLENKWKKLKKYAVWSSWNSTFYQTAKRWLRYTAAGSNAASNIQTTTINLEEMKITK